MDKKIYFLLWAFLYAAAFAAIMFILLFIGMTSCTPANPAAPEEKQVLVERVNDTLYAYDSTYNMWFNVVKIDSSCGYGNVRGNLRYVCTYRYYYACMMLINGVPKLCEYHDLNERY